MAAAGGSLVTATSNMTVGLDGLCLCGLAARNQVTTLAAAVSVGTEVAQVGSTSAFGNGARLVIDTGSAQETVVAGSVTATSFSATFANAHVAGAAVVLERQVVGRIDHTGQATQISQDFGNPSVIWVAASPIDANQLYCVSGDQQLWHTAAGASANAGTVWSAMPAGASVTGYQISTVAVDQAGTVFLLMLFPVTVGGSRRRGHPAIPRRCRGLDTDHLRRPAFRGLWLRSSSRRPERGRHTLRVERRVYVRDCRDRK
jgi:hypothetical protein